MYKALRSGATCAAVAYHARRQRLDAARVRKLRRLGKTAEFGIEGAFERGPRIPQRGVAQLRAGCSGLRRQGCKGLEQLLVLLADRGALRFIIIGHTAQQVDECRHAE